MTDTEFEAAVRRARAGDPVPGLVDELLAALNPYEKLDLLDGDTDFWPGMASMMIDGYNVEPIVMGEIARIGLPGLRFADGPRGVVVGRSTAFPVSMARGATWDVGLEERIGDAIGAEMRAQGANFFGGVCINLPRHPAWGRAQETYGEDPVLLGEFGAALVRGVQRHAMAVAKHYALNSMENARFSVDVSAGEAALHEVFLPHFRRVVEEGVSGIMSAYNSVNGEWAGQNSYLLDEVLRGEWAFEGVVVSDFIWGLRDATASLRAGLDVEEPFRQQRARHLKDALRSGDASWADVDRAARRIIGVQLRYAVRVTTPVPGPEVVFSDAHRALAREAATRSMVLVKNDGGVLPFDAAGLRRVAVIGRLAGVANTGDHGSSDVRSPEVVTPLDGLRAALPDAEITYVPDDDPAAAAAAARDADVAIVVAGYTASDEGEFVDSSVFTRPDLAALYPPEDESPADAARLKEQIESGESMSGGEAAGGDRASLRLRPVDAEIIRAVAEANPRTAVAVVTAGAVITEEWRAAVPAVLFSWYAGAEGGHALADVLLGRADAGGRLPFSVPTSEEHLPFFDRDATEITYDKWFGQRLLDRLKVAAAFPLGFGLSYTTFALSAAITDAPRGDRFDVEVTVANTGTRAGRHVVQVYGCPLEAGDDFPARVLLGFAPVEIEPGEARTIVVPGSTRPLQRWTEKGFVPAASTARIEAGSYAGDPDALTVEIRPAPLPVPPR
jgi:beta-glucosidase-like glycosyl hydrolase